MGEMNHAPKVPLSMQLLVSRQLTLPNIEQIDLHDYPSAFSFSLRLGHKIRLSSQGRALCSV